MASETCSGKVDCAKKIIELLKKKPDCVLKANIKENLKMYIKDPNISPVAYKRLLCFSQSSCDGNWNRNCSSISQFKKSKKRSKSHRKTSHKLPPKTSHKLPRKTSHKSPTKPRRKSNRKKL